MIVETIVSTVDRLGKVNFAPMGVLWGQHQMVIRPFKTTKTFDNLMATRGGVVNITDNAMLFALSALSDVEMSFKPATCVPGGILEDACEYFELRLLEVDEEKERAWMNCEVVNRGFIRPFLGFNRGKNAVIEATILATRVHLIGKGDVLAALDKYQEVVLNTGDDEELQAINFVLNYVRKW
jgi:hypothetical protein